MREKGSWALKISGPAGAGAAALRRTEKRKSGEGSSFTTADSVGGGSGAAATTGANPIAAVDSLLTLQEVADPEQGNRESTQHGKDVLDLLDEIRLGLLNGRIPEHRLKALVRMLAGRSNSFVDPRLSQIVDEIDLRARVELAKLGH